ncbi:MAG TPA: serine hydrolase domain-containing protein [Urbifossiella sp.]|nr:serine hydrolase domain-containing protein [Urbifossiella sp.]
MTRALAILILFIPSQAPAQTYAKAAKAEAAAAAEVAKQELVGTAVVVIDGGAVVWARGYGHADREAGLAVDPAATQFRWASVSKPVTAVAALQLVEKGNLDLDADVRRYVPEFPDHGEKVTARQLLCHQGGVVHYSNGKVVKSARDYADPHPFADVVTALDTFKASPLVHRPGEKYAYSTHGYVLLSAVVQRAGRRPFAEQVKARIADPLRMTGFRPDYEWEAIPHRAAGYRRKDGEITRRPADLAPDVSWKLGGGGYTSPATAMAAFGVGLLNRKLVTEPTERLMWAPTRPSEEQPDRPYGLGFGLGTTPGGVKWVGHSGAQEKTRTALILDPAGKRGVVVMTNSEWAEPGRLAAAVLDAIR